MDHLRDAHCNEYLAKQLRCFAEPQSGSAQRLTAFRYQIIIMVRATEKALDILIQAQRECEELYIRGGEQGKVIELPEHERK